MAQKVRKMNNFVPSLIYGIRTTIAVLAVLALVITGCVAFNNARYPAPHQNVGIRIR